MRTAAATAAHVEAAAERRAEYLLIGGPAMSRELAAARLGYSIRTISRWRAALGLAVRGRQPGAEPRRGRDRYEW